LDPILGIHLAIPEIGALKFWQKIQPSFAV
jgi:hypothetical protein